MIKQAYLALNFSAPHLQVAIELLMCKNGLSLGDFVL